MSDPSELLHSFDHVDCVVDDPLRFKNKLAIGEDAYMSLRLKNAVVQLWNVYGAASAGWTFASSAHIAGIFFARTGLMAALGLGGAAATPIGWVIAASVVTGGAYYGVTRLMSGVSASRVDVIPKFINTPLDLIAASLMDMLGALSIKVAAIDGHIHDQEIKAMADYFVDEWGFNREYAEEALSVIEEGCRDITMKDLTARLSQFIVDNPDCNAGTLRKEILDLLKEIAEADGHWDEREELAIEHIGNQLTRDQSVTTKAMRVAKVPVRIARSAGTKTTSLLSRPFLRRRKSDSTD